MFILNEKKCMTLDNCTTILFKMQAKFDKEKKTISKVFHMKIKQTLVNLKVIIIIILGIHIVSYSNSNL